MSLPEPPEPERPSARVAVEPDSAPAETSEAPGPVVPAPAPPAALKDDANFLARLRRAFAVRHELDAAHREASSLETLRERAVALLGEAAWSTGTIPAAASAVAEQVRRLDVEIGQQGQRAAEIEGLLARHDESAATEESMASGVFEVARKAFEDVESRYREMKSQLDALEAKIATLRATADREDTAARAARAEADGLGAGTLTAEERIRREAEIDAARVASERAAAEARSGAAALEKELPALRAALDEIEAVLSDRAAERDHAELELSDRRERTGKAREELADTLTEVHARTERLRVDRTRLLAALGSAAAATRPSHPTLDSLYGELGAIETRLASARTHVARLESESGRLRAVRIAAVAGGALCALLLVLLVLVYALR